MENLKEYISKKRPTLCKSSLTTYASILKNIYKRVFGDGDVDFKKFDEVDDVMKYWKDIPANRSISTQTTRELQAGCAERHKIRFPRKNSRMHNDR